jgi:hypothetical protein
MPRYKPDPVNNVSQPAARSRLARPSDRDTGWRAEPAGSHLPFLSRREAVRLFLFFSNRLGCLGSLLVSAVLTVVLLLILGVL